MPETRREITECYQGGYGRWYLKYRVWGTNGRDLGEWPETVTSIDEAGAKLKLLAQWAKSDKINAKRRERAVKKGANDG